MISALVYAGASQFALLATMGGPAPASVAVALALNLRHALYGPVLASRLGDPGPRGRVGWLQAAAKAFGLTDEVFAVASARMTRARPGRGWWAALTLTAYGAWLAGTLAGAAAGEGLLRVLPSVQPALSFALPALFVALLQGALAIGPAGRAAGRAAPGSPPRGAAAAALGGAVGAAAAILSGWEGWAVPAGAACGLLAGAARRRWRR